MAKTDKETKTFTRKQVFMALLPWGIIVLGTIFFLGNVNGWNMRGIQMDQVRSEAAQLKASK